MNRYQYVQSSPLVAADPSGHLTYWDQSTAKICDGPEGTLNPYVTAHELPLADLVSGWDVNRGSLTVSADGQLALARIPFFTRIYVEAHWEKIGGYEVWGLEGDELSYAFTWSRAGYVESNFAISTGVATQVSNGHSVSLSGGAISGEESVAFAVETSTEFTAGTTIGKVEADEFQSGVGKITVPANMAGKLVAYRMSYWVYQDYVWGNAGDVGMNNGDLPSEYSKYAPNTPPDDIRKIGSRSTPLETVGGVTGWMFGTRRHRAEPLKIPTRQTAVVMCLREQPVAGRASAPQSCNKP